MTYKYIIDLSIDKLFIDGMLIIEHNKKIDLSPEPNHCMNRKYGDIISFLIQILKKQACKPDSV